MTDFIRMDEGAKYLLTAGDGLPATCYFALSTDAVASFSAGTTLAGGIAEITGTGYARQSQAAPTPGSTGSCAFAQMTWSTSSATDWPSSVKSIVLVTSSDNSGKAICAWNLQAGGAGRDLSAANTTEAVTPTLTI